MSEPTDPMKEAPCINPEPFSLPQPELPKPYLQQAFRCACRFESPMYGETGGFEPSASAIIWTNRCALHNVQVEKQTADLRAALAAQTERADRLHEDLATAIQDGNRSREIIYAMAEALNPDTGEHNIDCAKRVAAQHDKLQAEATELELNLELGRQQYGILTAERDKWESDAKRYCENSEYWRVTSDKFTEQLAALQADRDEWKASANYLNRQADYFKQTLERVVHLYEKQYDDAGEHRPDWLTNALLTPPTQQASAWPAPPEAKP